MKKIRCVAIDDEPLALMVITKFCERQGNMELETFCSPEDGMKKIKESIPDIIFLDVEMNEASGLDLAKQIPQQSCLIFTTAHAQYALDGFNLDATDFLHKPFSYDRFLQAVNKVIRKKTGENDLHGYISLMSEYRNVTFRLSSILYIEALGNYTKIYTTDGKNTVAHANMRNVGRQLPERYFCRVQRSYIVSILQVASYNRSSVTLFNCARTIPVGNQYADDLEAKMNAARCDITSVRTARFE